jgi:hypothetical protein
VLKTWADGDVLTAADLNGNFTNVQSQIDTLHAKSGAIWKDATGAIIPVLSGEPSTGTLRMADSKGYVWTVSALDGTAYAAVGNANVLYSSSSCSGTTYVGAVTPRVVFTLSGDTTFRVIADNANLGSISYASYGNYGGGSCFASGGTQTAVPLSATRPSQTILKPAAPFFTPPAHPELAP